MSIVAIKIDKSKIIIGADSFVGFSYDSQLKDKDVKLFKQNGLIVGCVGYASDCALLRVFCKTRKPLSNREEDILEFLVEFMDWAKTKKTNYILESSFMIVFSKKAYFISSALYIKEIKDYQAMGAGQDMAMAALMLGKNVQEALTIACELSIYCEKPIKTYQIKL